MNRLNLIPRFWLFVFAIVFCIGSFTAHGQESPSAENIAEWHKAAEQGDAGAQHNLGNCYARGQGVVKNAVEAVKWYRKAAEQGDADAQLDLGLCYSIGLGVAKDKAKAAQWYRKVR